MAQRHDAPLPTEARTGVLIGWRCWTVLRNEALLRPIWMRGLVWKPGVAHEAVCAAEGRDIDHRGHAHAVPAPSCKCGIWAVCHPKLLNEVDWTWKPEEILVIGQVALWGGVVEFARGWRAQFAYPSHLYAFTDDELLTSVLRDRYAVPVVWGAEADALRDVLPRGFLTGRPTPATDATGAPTVAVATEPPAAVLAMVRRHETERLRRLREALALEQAHLEEDRLALALEREINAAKRQRQTLTRRRSMLESVVGPAAPTSTSTALKCRAQEAGVTQDEIAVAAGVTRSAVCHVLAGRARSQKVVDVAEQLTRERQGKDGPQRPPLSAAVAAFCAANKISQNQVAARAGVDPSILSRLLNGTITSRPAEEKLRTFLAGARAALGLKAVVDAAGVSYGEIAKRAGVSWKMVYMVVNGKKTSAPVSQAIAQLTGATIMSSSRLPLRDRLRRAGITLQAVAAEASTTSTRGSVGIPTVSRVLAGRTMSANVVSAAERLIAAAARRRGGRA